METPMELQEIEKMFDDGQVLAACRRLMKEINNSKDLAEPALALIDKGFNKENLTSKELGLLHRGLAAIVLANPDLAEEALKRFQKGFSLIKEPWQIDQDYDSIAAISIKRPDLSGNLFDLQHQVEAHFKEIGGKDSIGSNVYQRVRELTRSLPDIGQKYLDDADEKLSRKNIDAVDLCCASAEISQVLQADSKYSAQSLPLIEKGIDSKANNANSLAMFYGDLSFIYSLDNTLIDSILPLFDKGLQSEENNEKSIDLAKNSLITIVEECPDLADKGLDLNKGPKELLVDIQDELKKQQLTSTITNKLQELKSKMKTGNIEDIPHLKTQILREVAKDNLGKPKRSDADKAVIKAAVNKAISKTRK